MPTPVALPATNIGTAGAQLNGTVNPGGVGVFAWFEYGPTTAYGSETAHVDVGSGSSPVPVSAVIGGLSPGSGYHFRVAAVAGTPPTPGAFGGSLPTRLATSGGSVINVTTAAQLETQLATCAFGSIIDCGNIPMTPPNGYYFQWTRNGAGTVTTVRNLNISNGELRVIKGQYLRVQDAVVNGSPYFGFKAEGGRYLEYLRCNVNGVGWSGWMMTVAADNTPTLDWQIWDSEDHNCGYNSGSVQSHSIYAETHTATCVIANHLSVAPKFFGFHISTDRTVAQNPYVDGLVVTGCTHVNSNQRGAFVLYGNNQPNNGQVNVKMVGIINQGSATGIMSCYPPLGSNNRMYGCVKYTSGADYQLANVAPIYGAAGGSSGVVTTNPLLDGSYRPAAGSSATDIVPTSMYGYLPAYDKDGIARVTADAGCYST